MKKVGLQALGPRPSPGLCGGSAARAAPALSEAVLRCSLELGWGWPGLGAAPVASPCPVGLCCEKGFWQWVLPVGRAAGALQNGGVLRWSGCGGGVFS